MTKSPLAKYAEKVYSLDYKDRFGERWRGNFIFKPEMTRREAFQADARRRSIVGGIPAGQEAPPALQGEAYMLGVLSVRITEAPSWWHDSDGGLELSDPGIIVGVFDLLTQMDEEIAEKLTEKAEQSTAKVKPDTE